MGKNARAWALASALVVFANLAFAATEEDREQGWAKTTIGLELIHKFTRDITPCDKSAENYLSCLYLVAGVAEQYEPTLTMIPKGIESIYPGIQVRVDRDLGELQFGEVKDWGQKVSTMESARRYRAMIDKIREVAGRMYESGFRPEFENIVEAMLSSVPQKVSRQRAIATAINKMIRVKDAHGHLDALDYYEDRSKDADRQFPGVGVSISTADEGAVVDDVFEGSPADSAHLQVNDVVVAANGVSLKGLSLEKVVENIRGPEGVEVLLEVQRGSKDNHLFLALKRERVKMENVKFRLLEDLGSTWAYLKLGTFKDEKACETIKTHLQSLKNTPAKGVILDLRGNPGGEVDQAVCIAGLFFGQKLVVTQKPVRPSVIQMEYEYISDEKQVTDLPLVVLVNHGSASASELLAGAIRDHKRGWLMGTRTFGKGTVQSGRPWRYDAKPAEILRFVTTHRFYQPSGLTNQIVGIAPDFEVYPRTGLTEEQMFVMREAELVPTALPPEGPQWVQPRPREVAAMNFCMSQGLAERTFAAREKETIIRHRPDLQLLKAQELLGCAQKGN